MHPLPEKRTCHEANSDLFTIFETITKIAVEHIYVPNVPRP